MTEAAPIQLRFHVHLDGGANVSITNNKNNLINYRDIGSFAMAGVSHEQPAIYCNGIGDLPWCSDDGTVLLAKCYYSEHAADTIISPTDVVIHNIHEYYAWGQYSNLDTGQGYVEFYKRDGVSKTHFSLTLYNGLWDSRSPMLWRASLDPSIRTCSKISSEDGDADN